MPKPDNDLINRFRVKFGDLLLTCGERESGDGVIDSLHSKPSTSSIKGTESLDAMQIDTINPKLILGLANASPVPCSFIAPGSLCPTVSGGKHIPVNRGIPGWGAVFHNGAGDSHSPMVQCAATTAALLDAPIRHTPTTPWAESSPFAPLSLTRNWSCEDRSFSLQPDYDMEFMTHHDAGHISLDNLDHVPLTNYMSQQTILECDSIIYEAKYTEDSHHGDEGKFHYNVVLEAPTAMFWLDKERPVTYLNKGQTYTLRVSPSKPPADNARFIQYRTFVRVAFEEQDQRSNPAASWQLWKEGRGLKEAKQRQSELLAVEYVDTSQDSASHQTYPQVRLEKSCVDGFCVTWTANPTTTSYEGVIALRFNFLSTDFTLSKGVKGVPVRLCVKTSVLRQEDRKEITEHDSEICCCAVKLFRDHGAERKLANDEAIVKKKVTKLNKEIAKQYQSSGFIGLCHAYNPQEPCQSNRRHRSRKSFVKRRGSQTIDDLRLKLARMNEVLTSVRQLTVLGFRGTKEDDPDLHPVILPRRTCTSLETEILNNQQIKSGSVTLTSQVSVQRSKSSCLQRSCLQENPQSPLRPQSISLDASPFSSDISVLSSKAIACFYIKVNHGREVFKNCHHAIYLMERTVLDLKKRLAEKVQTDLTLIARIIWENSNGLKILVDDDVVQHIPEGQSMTAEFNELSDTGAIPTRVKSSVMEVKLVF